MHINDKLNSISKAETVAQLDALLDNANVAISWWGQRLVSVQGYTGTVDINQLIEKYLDAHPRASDGRNNLKARLNFYTLWTKVEKLCNSGLNNTWFYRFLVPVGESAYQRVWNGPSPRAVIVGTKSPSKEKMCFEFSPDDFKKLWAIDSVSSPEPWIATKEMVEEAFKQPYQDSHVPTEDIS